MNNFLYENDKHFSKKSINFSATSCKNSKNGTFFVLCKFSFSLPCPSAKGQLCQWKCYIMTFHSIFVPSPSLRTFYFSWRSAVVEFAPFCSIFVLEVSSCFCFLTSSACRWFLSTFPTFPTPLPALKLPHNRRSSHSRNSPSCIRRRDRGKKV